MTTVISREAPMGPAGRSCPCAIHVQGQPSSTNVPHVRRHERGRVHRGANSARSARRACGGSVGRCRPRGRRPTHSGMREGSVARRGQGPAAGPGVALVRRPPELGPTTTEGPSATRLHLVAQGVNPSPRGRPRRGRARPRGRGSRGSRARRATRAGAGLERRDPSSACRRCRHDDDQIGRFHDGAIEASRTRRDPRSATQIAQLDDPEAVERRRRPGRVTSSRVTSAGDNRGGSRRRGPTAATRAAGDPELGASHSKRGCAPRCPPAPPDRRPGDERPADRRDGPDGAARPREPGGQRQAAQASRTGRGSSCE